MEVVLALTKREHAQGPIVPCGVFPRPRANHPHVGQRIDVVGKVMHQNDTDEEGEDQHATDPVGHEPQSDGDTQVEGDADRPGVTMRPATNRVLP